MMGAMSGAAGVVLLYAILRLLTSETSDIGLPLCQKAPTYQRGFWSLVTTALLTCPQQRDEV